MATERFVEFRSGRNVLRGMIHRPRTGRKAPGVVMLHGFTDQRMGPHFILVKAARELARRGIAALRFDFAGSGESEGRFQDMSVMTELADARCALSYVARRRRVDSTRLGVLGHSLGGCVAAMLLEDPRLAAGVLWAPVADLAPLAETTAPPLAEAELARKGYVELAAHKIGRAFVDDVRRADPVSALRRSAADVLVVHGAKDEAVPLDHARALARAGRTRRNGTRTELVVLRDADHTFERVRDEEEVIRLSVEWFAEALLKPNGARTAGEKKRARRRKGT